MVATRPALSTSIVHEIQEVRSIAMRFGGGRIRDGYRVSMPSHS